MNRRGNVLIESLTMSIVATIIGIALITILQTDITAWSVINGQNISNATARQPLDILADQFRNAQPYGSSTTQVLYAASAHSISPYTSTSGTYVTYWLNTAVSPPALEETSGTTNSVLVSGVSSLTFTYYVSGGSYTPATSSWVTTANPNAPSATELPNVAAIGINAVITVNGYSRTVATYVRLRNSPTSPPAWG